MSSYPRNRHFDARRATWIKVVCAFIFTAALIVIPTLMPNTNGAFTAKITNPTNSVKVASPMTCRQVMSEETGGVFAYQLNTTNPVNLVDKRTSTAVMTAGATQAGRTGCRFDTEGYSIFTGSAITPTTVKYNPSVIPPETYTQELWFRNTGVLAGRAGSLIALSNSDSATLQSKNSRHIYFDIVGKIVVGTNGYEMIESGVSAADGEWHHIVVTRDKSNRTLSLYLDGAIVGTVQAATSLDTFSPANWKIGCSYIAGLPGAPLRNCFTGDIAFAAVYNRAFTQADVTRHYKAGTG